MKGPSSQGKSKVVESYINMRKEKRTMSENLELRREKAKLRDLRQMEKMIEGYARTIKGSTEHLEKMIEELLKGTNEEIKYIESILKAAK